MTPRSFSLFVVALLVSAPAAAEEAPADAEPPERFQDSVLHLGLGSGWAIPVGNAESGVPLGDVMLGQAPLALDAGFRALPHVFVGAYASWGFGAVPDCPGTGRCRGRGIRFGLNGRYLFEPSQGGPHAPVPWVGLGAGFESLTTRVASAERSYQGISYVDLQLGLDVPLFRQLAIGPTLSLSAGEFTRATVEGADSAAVEADIAESRIHGWIVTGARLVFGS